METNVVQPCLSAICCAFWNCQDPHCRNPDVAALARQSAAVRATPHDAMHLGGDDNLVPPGKILDGASQNFLASVEAVDSGRIKEIDAQIQRSLDDGFAVFFVPRPFVYSAFGIAKAHAAEAQRRDIQTCLPSFTYSLVWGRRGSFFRRKGIIGSMALSSLISCPVRKCPSPERHGL